MIKSCAAIVIAAKHGELIKVKDASGIAYTVGTLRCKFDFRTTDWDYTTRTAVFCKGNVLTNPKVAETAIGVLLDGVDECAVPPEVLLPDERYFSVGVWGVTGGGLRIVSEWLVFRIKDGCYVDSAESFLPTPSTYEQIMIAIGSKAPIDHKHEEYITEEELSDKGYVTETYIEDILKEYSKNENGTAGGVQSDWDQTDETKLDYIKNKPVVDQSYTEDSINAQSGIAVAEAIGTLREDLATNIEVGIGVGSIQQVADNVENGIDFTGENPKAEELDDTLSAVQPYGAVGNYSHAEGGKCSAQGKRSHAEGTTTIAKGDYSHAEGNNSVALGANSHAEGKLATSYGENSHAEGYNTISKGNMSHSEGDNTEALELASHSEGSYTKAIGYGSHAEGVETKAVGEQSHAEGYNTTAGGKYSHAEGANTNASGDSSHAQGLSTIASGNASFASGVSSQADAGCSNALGLGLYTNAFCATAVGKYNKDNSDALLQVGNGDNDGKRSNAFEVLNDGRAKVYSEPKDLNDVVRLHENNKKFDKDGGIISGHVAIQGNLSISGTTMIKDTETLQVKDNIVVTNSDGIELIEESGFAIKTDTTNAYGIMYDPVGDGVKIGLGGFDEDGKFTYTEGQAQFLATRADHITDGNIPKWDNEKKQFIDSGVGSDEVVKFTDYATASKAGVGMVSQSQGIYMNSGYFCIQPATNTDIDNATSIRMPITTSNYKHAVKKGITTNTEEWTDEDKAKACETIGAVKTDTEKSGKYNSPLVYTNDEDTKHYLATHHSGFIVYNIPMIYGAVSGRDAVSGWLVSGLPINDYHAANKKYVDDNFVAIPNTTAYGSYVIQYVVTENGKVGVIGEPIKVQGSAGANTIPLRGVNGVVSVGTPTEDTHAVPKKYAEDNFVAKPTATSGFTRVPTVNANTLDVGYLSVYNGTNAGTIAMRGAGGVLKCGDPVAQEDATTKKYVDDAIANIGGSGGGSAKLYLHEITFNDTAIGPEERSDRAKIISAKSTQYTSLSENDFVDGSMISCHVHMYTDNSQTWSSYRSVDNYNIMLHGMKDVTTSYIMFSQINNGLTDTVTEINLGGSGGDNSALLGDINTALETILGV